MQKKYYPRFFAAGIVALGLMLLSTAVLAQQENLNGPDRDKIQDYYNLGGTVFAGQYPLQVFDASLICNDGPNFIFIDKVTYDTLGYYYFMNLPPLKFLVKAEPVPGSPESRDFIPTYTGNVMHWQNATIAWMYQDIYNMDIQLMHSEVLMQGTGNIGGHLEHYDKNTGSKAPFPGAEILIKNLQGQALGFCNTDGGGHFLFPNIAFGTYVIFPEVEGIVTAPAVITIGPGNPNSNLNFVMTDNNISGGITDAAGNPQDCLSLPYPMPAQDVLNLSYSFPGLSKVRYAIYDISGRIVAGPFNRDCEGDGLISIDTSPLLSGTYTLRIDIDGKTPYIQKVTIIR
jgi:hypothetical protein